MQMPMPWPAVAQVLELHLRGAGEAGEICHSGSEARDAPADPRNVRAVPREVILGRGRAFRGNVRVGRYRYQVSAHLRVALPSSGRLGQPTTRRCSLLLHLAPMRRLVRLAAIFLLVMRAATPTLVKGRLARRIGLRSHAATSSGNLPSSGWKGICCGFAFWSVGLRLLA